MTSNLHSKVAKATGLKCTMLTVTLQLFRTPLACMISSTFIHCNEITALLLDYMQAVKQHFSHFAKWDRSLKVVFQKSEITLNIPEEGITQEGWKITPMTYPVVCLYCIQVCMSASTQAVVFNCTHLCRLLREMLMSSWKGNGFLNVS